MKKNDRPSILQLIQKKESLSVIKIEVQEFFSCVFFTKVDSKLKLTRNLIEQKRGCTKQPPDI